MAWSLVEWSKGETQAEFSTVILQMGVQVVRGSGSADRQMEQILCQTILLRGAFKCWHRPSRAFPITIPFHNEPNEITSLRVVFLLASCRELLVSLRTNVRMMF